MIKVFRNSQHVLYISKDYNYHKCTAVKASLFCFIIYPPQLDTMQYKMTHCTWCKGEVHTVWCTCHWFQQMSLKHNFQWACQSFKGKNVVTVDSHLFGSIPTSCSLQRKMDGPASKIPVWKHGSKCVNP
jgi:hypothetical protein